MLYYCAGKKASCWHFQIITELFGCSTNGAEEKLSIDKNLETCEDLKMSAKRSERTKRTINQEGKATDRWWLANFDSSSYKKLDFLGVSIDWKSTSHATQPLCTLMGANPMPGICKTMPAWSERTVLRNSRFAFASKKTGILPAGLLSSVMLTPAPPPRQAQDGKQGNIMRPHPLFYGATAVVEIRTKSQKNGVNSGSKTKKKRPCAFCIVLETWSEGPVSYFTKEPLGRESVPSSADVRCYWRCMLEDDMHRGVG